MNLFEVFDLEKTLRLIDDTYCDLKKVSKEDRNAMMEVKNIRYYYYVGKEDEDVRSLYQFLQKFQDNALCMAEAKKIETNRDNLLDEGDIDEFNEVRFCRIYMLSSISF